MIKVIIIALTTVKCYQNKTNLRDLHNYTNKDNVTMYPDSITYRPSIRNSTLNHSSESTEQILCFVFSFFGVLICMFICILCKN